MIHTKESETEYITALLIKRIKRDFGKPCKEQAVGCAICDAYRLVAYLEWLMMVESIETTQKK